MQKTYRLFTFILFFSIFPGCFASKHASQNNAPIVDDHGNVCSQVRQILDLTNIKTDGSLQDIVTKTQQAWLRKAGTERWEMETYLTEQDAALKKLFHEMNMFEAIQPQQKQYTYFLLLGALFKTMDQRFAHAIELYNSGIRFDAIVLLAGARPALPAQGENETTFLNYNKAQYLNQIPQTESEMLQFVYDHAIMPASMRNIPVQMIDVPMQTTPSGNVTRPTTADTIVHWLATNPKPGNCLAISNQPYVQYQQSVLQTLLPAGFSVETVGVAAKDNNDLAVMLDTLARILYQEQKRIQKYKI